MSESLPIRIDIINCKMLVLYHNEIYESIYETDESIYEIYVSIYEIYESIYETYELHHKEKLHHVKLFEIILVLAKIQTCVKVCAWEIYKFVINFAWAKVIIMHVDEKNFLNS